MEVKQKQRKAEKSVSLASTRATISNKMYNKKSAETWYD